MEGTSARTELCHQAVADLPRSPLGLSNFVKGRSGPFFSTRKAAEVSNLKFERPSCVELCKRPQFPGHRRGARDAQEDLVRAGRDLRASPLKS